ncbi:aminopeptidase PepB [Frischella perrara]|uniref:Aminopeptidase PepB n=2 Tax=Frischella perrara TaxID=1267021 RepID=A0A318MZ55_FRIPE|nr:aminopeptidase PepB [Frischella perrara]MCT6875150.1 aminopeptidase PepB [Frischella perrara]PXY96887.1 aminopeptidase PepB [Frischella perrara]
MTTMSIFLSLSPADEKWGKSALLSYSEQGITIHCSTTQHLETIQKAGRKIESQGIYDLQLVGDAWDLEANWHFWLGYRHPKTYHKAKITWSNLNQTEQQELNNRLAIIDWTRNTINQPADEQSPMQLAQCSADLISSLSKHVTFKYLAGEMLKDNNLMGIYTVGKGSSRPPVLLELDYNPSQDKDTPVTVCLVGKGITFDSGGYSLKPTQFMETMRADMGGAALVTGALALAISRGLQSRVKLYLCCADNLVSGDAFKLGDIIRYRNDVSVEIENTDAEGRLVLADGLLCANDDNPKYLIDCATLTGAAKVAVGNDYHSLLSFDQALSQRLLACAQAEYEPFWQLPLAEFHRSQFPSSFADIGNSGLPNTAGASTAAAFLSYFVNNYKNNWLHIDCSATFRKSANALWATGATGVGVRALANLLMALE